jgi:hypothetical protein
MPISSAAVWLCLNVPVPTETSRMLSAPVRQRNPWPCSAATISSCSDGSLNGLTPPSTNAPSTKLPSFDSIRICSGAKYVGAAVLARTTCVRKSFPSWFA